MVAGETSTERLPKCGSLLKLLLFYCCLPHPLLPFNVPHLFILPLLAVYRRGHTVMLFLLDCRKEQDTMEEKPFTAWMCGVSRAEKHNRIYIIRYK